MRTPNAVDFPRTFLIEGNAGWLALMFPVLAGLGFAYSDNASAAQYFPLAEGDRWVFHVTLPKRVKPDYRLVRTVTRVSAESPAGADARSRPVYAITEEDYSIPKSEWPEEPIEYSVRENGDVYCAKCGGFILKAPLDVQQSWVGGLGYGAEILRVVAVHKAVEAGGKLYRDCVVVESVAGEEHTVTSYAPGVGPVRVEVFEGVSKQPVRREELVSFARGVGLP